MTLESLLQHLGPPRLFSITTFSTNLTPLSTIEEESFVLFSSRQNCPPPDLGFVDRKKDLISVTICPHGTGYEWGFSIRQNVSVLNSNREGGTTGAVLWRITPNVLNWLLSPENVFWKHGILHPAAVVLELGCGVSGLVGLAFVASAMMAMRNENESETEGMARSKNGGRGKISRVILTDQDYVLKTAKMNVAEGLDELGLSGKWEAVDPSNDDNGVSGSSFKVDLGKWKRTRNRKKKKNREAATIAKTPTTSANENSNNGEIVTIGLFPLDWELTSRTKPSSPCQSGRRPDLVIALDCIYNEALVEPLVETVYRICLPTTQTHPTSDGRNGMVPRSDTVVLVALELRSVEVLELFLEKMVEKRFALWRLEEGGGKEGKGKDESADEPFGMGSGMVGFVAVLF